MTAPKTEAETKGPSQNAESVLVDHLKVFLRCGGIFDYADFEEFSPEIIAALARASKEIDVEHALILAEAIRSADGALRVAAALDGGDGVVRSWLILATDRYLRKRGVPY